MKVLRLTPHYYFESGSWPKEFDPLGGMQTQITSLSECLHKMGVAQFIITSGYPGASSFSERGLRVKTVSNFRFHIKNKISGVLCFDLYWLVGTIKYLYRHRRALQGFGIVHHHFSGTYASMVAFFIARRICASSKHVITIHCSRNFTFLPPTIWSKCLNPFIKRMEAACITEADHIIVLTEQTRQRYCRAGFHQKRIEVIGDGIASYHIKDRENSKTRNPVIQFLTEHTPECHKRVAFIGRISFEKGFETVIEIAERINREDITFWVVGDGPEREEMQKEIKRRNLMNKFLFTGFVSRLLIPEIMALLDVLIVPSHHEEFGGVVLEGVAANVPIVTSGAGGILQILGNQYNGLAGCNVLRYISCINSYLDKTVSANYDREEILNRYAMSKCVERIVKLYRQGGIE